jgi:hypothetical protein
VADSNRLLMLVAVGVLALAVLALYLFTRRGDR